MRTRKICSAVSAIAFFLCASLTAQQNDYPLQSAIVVAAASGSVQIIAVPTGGQATRPIYIGWLSAAWNTSATVKLVYGTGTNCGTGTTDITGGYATATNLDLYPGSSRSPIIVPKGNAVCINFSTTVTGGGIVKYAN